MNIQITNEGITINGETMHVGTAYGEASETRFIVYRVGDAQKWRIAAYGGVFDEVKSEFARRLMSTATGGYHALRPDNDIPLCGLTVSTFPIEF